jgi:hypothetical protein
MIKKLITYIVLLALLCACEETIPFNESVQNEINIFALAVTGQNFKAYISHNLPIDQGPNFYYLDYSSFCDETETFFKEELVMENANAIIRVNGSASYPLTFNQSELYYSCDYIPNEGDVIEIQVRAEGYPEASAQTKVNKSLELSDLQYSVYYDEAASKEEHEWMKRFSDYDVYGADSVMAISFSFQDPAGAKNYYRLKVRSVGEYLGFLNDTCYCVSDVFTSTDPIFHDSQLIKGYGSWEPYFSNVFDDHLIDGDQYTVNVHSRKRAESPSYTIIELQSISRDLYYFLKSMQLYRISTDDVYSTPIGIYGNIDNGWGIFGSVSKNTYVINR